MAESRPSARALVGGRRTVAAVAAVGVVAAALFVSPRAVLAWLAGLAADPVAFGVAVLALYLLRPAVALPTTLCSVAVGYGFGLAGLPVALAGAALSALGPYYATRALLDDPEAGERTELRGRLATALGGAVGRARAAGRRYFAGVGDVRGVVVARLVPLPADPVTAGAAAAGVSARALVVGTALGEVPWTVAAVAVGASARRLPAVEAGAAGVWPAVGALALAGLLLAGPVYRRLDGDGRERERRDGASNGE
jgi:uncharacterized membrane protein YdjX (TVP38/TMEM64 family)